VKKITKMATKTIQFNIDEVDVELFISEVKLHPKIWNIADNNYHDRTKKEEHGLKFVECFVKDSTKRMNGIKMIYI